MPVTCIARLFTRATGPQRLLDGPEITVFRGDEVVAGPEALEPALRWMGATLSSVTARPRSWAEAWLNEMGWYAAYNHNQEQAQQSPWEVVVGAWSEENYGHSLLVRAISDAQPMYRAELPQTGPEEPPCLHMIYRAADGDWIWWGMDHWNNYVSIMVVDEAWVHSWLERNRGLWVRIDQ
jgi:hypothetical protein